MAVKTRAVTGVLVAVLALQFFTLCGAGWTAPTEKIYLQEVARLAALESAYFQKKIKESLIVVV